VRNHEAGTGGGDAAS